MIVFQILSGGRANDVVQFEQQKILIGREPGCTLQLDPYQDLLVHGQHAKVYFADGHYFLEDLGTKNGTFLNDAPIKKPIQLESGLVFQLGPEGPKILVEKWDASEKNDIPAPPFQLLRTDSQEVFSFSQALLKIGRQPDCDLSLDPLKERGVSGYHAKILYDGRGYFVEDLSSANGTYLNGTLCSKGELQDGSIIQLGKDGPEFKFVKTRSTTSSEPSIPTKTVRPKAKKIEGVGSREDEKPDQVIEDERGKGDEGDPPKEDEKVREKLNKRLNMRKLGRVKKNSAKGYEKLLQLPKKYLALAATTFFVVIFLLWIVIPEEERQVLDAQTIEKEYRSSVMLVYCRYLVYVGDQVYRGQHYGCGILYQENSQIFLLTPQENIYPWKNSAEESSRVAYLVSHVVSAWPYNASIFERDSAAGYLNLDFPNSFNNDIDRLGGRGRLALPYRGDSNSEKLCKIEIRSEEEFLAQNARKWKLASDVSNGKLFYMTYNRPDPSREAISTLSVVEATGFQSATHIYGGPVLNEYGELLGLSQKENEQKLRNIPIKSMLLNIESQ